MPVSSALAQSESIELTGTITDAREGRPLVGATVFVEETSGGASTDREGRYSLELPPGRYTLVYNFVGFQSETRRVNLQDDRTLDVALEQSTIELGEVLVTETAAEKNLESLGTGVEELDVAELERLPTFMGEADIIRSLLKLPGVSSVGEGSAGFNVRGGGVDQNLILFEGTPVYYPSHLFGFFSPFNADVVSEATLYKGGIPAKYGGRASAVLDVEQKVGHRKEYHGRGGVSPITSRLSIEGPIVEDKASFITGGRLSYVDWLKNATGNSQLENSDAFFYDANVGVNIKPSESNEYDGMGYRAFDNVVLGDTTFTYATTSASLEWKNVINDNLVLRTEASASNYGFEVRDSDPVSAFRLDSFVRTYKLRSGMTWLPNDRHAFDFGVETKYYSINPATITPLGSESSVNAFSQRDEYGLETGLYVGDDWTLTDRLSARLGVRVSAFQQLGPATTFAFAPSQPRRLETITDTTTTTSGSVAETYFGVEPRLSLRYKIDDKSSVKASYNRMKQYLHLISNTTAALPLDVWHLSDRYRKPQVADQVSLGYFRNFRDGALITSAEVYYKALNNVVDYKAGADLLVNPALNTDLLQGIGRSYGLELFVNKTEGHLTGTIGYTYSRALRKVDGEAFTEQINNGDWYPADYDRPHDLNVALTYVGDDPRVSWNFNFVYRTGRPITYPVSKFVIERIALAGYSGRNQFRIPDYHRLDLSLRIDLERREKSGWNGSWTFSMYNVYGRRNAYSIFFGRQENQSVPQAYRLSVFGTIFPSLTYSFEF